MTQEATAQSQGETTQQTEKPAFSKDMIIMDVVKFYPEAVEVFMDYGLHCIGCHISGYETIAEGAQGHGMPPEELENMMLDAKEKIDEHAARLKEKQAESATNK